MTGRGRRDGSRVAQAALAACTGATDLLAVATLGGVFASVVTGNLVTIGYDAGRGDLSALLVPVVAVAAYAIGVALCLWVWRGRPYAVVQQLVAELALLVGVAAGWLATGGQPGRTSGMALLAAAALAMGAQSATSLRLHASTTYLTGTLTGAVHDLVTGIPVRRIAAIRQLVALVVGAGIAGALLAQLRWSAPLAPLLFLSTATIALAARPAPVPTRRSDMGETPGPGQ